MGGGVLDMIARGGPIEGTAVRWLAANGFDADDIDRAAQCAVEGRAGWRRRDTYREPPAPEPDADPEAIPAFLKRGDPACRFGSGR